MSIASVFSTFTAKIKSGLARLAQVAGIAVASQVADAFTAAHVEPLRFAPPSPRRRAAGPARPAGSKLARKAAEGTVGKATLR